MLFDLIRISADLASRSQHVYLYRFLGGEAQYAWVREWNRNRRWEGLGHEREMKDLKIYKISKPVGI